MSNFKTFEAVIQKRKNLLNFLYYGKVKLENYCQISPQNLAGKEQNSFVLQVLS